MIFYEKKYINSKNFSSFGAFSFDKTVDFSLMIPIRCGATNVSMHLFGEGIENHKYQKFDFVWTGIDGAYDLYSCTIDMAQIGVGLYYYKYQVSAEKTFYLGDGYRLGELSIIENDSNGLIQLLIFNEKSNCAKWMHGGIMYQIFVDRFNKSGKCKHKK